MHAEIGHKQLRVDQLVDERPRLVERDVGVDERRRELVEPRAGGRRREVGVQVRRGLDGDEVIAPLDARRVRTRVAEPPGGAIDRVFGR